MAHTTVLALALFASAALASPAPLLQAALESATARPCGWSCSSAQMMPAPQYQPYPVPRPCSSSYITGCRVQGSSWGYPGTASASVHYIQQQPSYGYVQSYPSYPSYSSYQSYPSIQSPSIDYLLRNQQGGEQ